MPEKKRNKSIFPNNLKIEVNGKTYIRNTETIKKLHKENPNLATFITFKPLYDAAGKELKMEDCEEIRNNMVRLGRTLLEFHKEENKRRGNC